MENPNVIEEIVLPYINSRPDKCPDCNRNIGTLGFADIHTEYMFCPHCETRFMYMPSLRGVTWPYFAKIKKFDKSLERC